MVNPISQTRCGYVAIVGRPNVGKSTLLNRLIGQKLSITSRKAQTTRHRILGIHTHCDWQIIYLDTPGVHAGHKKALNIYMNKTTSHAIFDVDVVILVLEGLRWLPEDELALEKIKRAAVKTLLVVNKIDRVKDKLQLLPHLDSLAKKHDFLAIVPISAKTGKNVAALEAEIVQALPHGKFLFSKDQTTDRSLTFIVSEVIREKLFRLTHQELPYVTTVSIEQFELRKDIYHIQALIFVENINQKKMIIGKSGAKLKQVGHQARIDLEKLLNKKVFLQLWVKAKAGWLNDQNALSGLGYTE